MIHKGLRRDLERVISRYFPLVLTEEISRLVDDLETYVSENILQMVEMDEGKILEVLKSKSILVDKHYYIIVPGGNFRELISAIIQSGIVKLKDL